MPLDEARLAPLADRIIAAGLSHETDAMAGVAAEMRAEGLSVDELTDGVIPEAARELGRAWEDDRLSFVEVTLAMTRIQRLLRDALFDVPQDGSGPSILFALPEGEQHTLGGLVAVRRLRRMHCSACLAIGEKSRKVVELLHARRFDALFVSVATIEGLEIARDLIANVRRAYAQALPVAVGGAILCGTDQVMAERVRTQTGAAVASNDLSAALCALNLSPLREVRAVTA
jgi:methylmalonyl-CoA mutase cobalamin-binding subunit